MEKKCIATVDSAWYCNGACYFLVVKSFNSNFTKIHSAVDSAVKKVGSWIRVERQNRDFDKDPFGDYTVKVKKCYFSIGIPSDKKHEFIQACQENGICFPEDQQ